MSSNVPTDTRDEDCKAIVINVMKEQLQLIINPSDISVAHRVGLRKHQSPDRRNIVFKLCRRDLKYDILSACRQQRPKFFVNESLTPTRNKILSILRRAKNKHPSTIKSLRSYEGSITVYLSPKGRPTSQNQPLSQLRRVTVNTQRQLRGMLEEELQCSLEDLCSQWKGAARGD